MALKNFQFGAKDRFFRWLRDYPRATPIGVFCMTMLIILLAAWSIELAEKRARLADEQSEIDDIAAALERQAASNTAYLEATSALFASVNDMSPSFFHAFVARLRGVYDLAGVVGLGWSRVVEPEDLPALKQSMAISGYPDFQIFPAPEGRQQTVHAVTMIEPETPANRKLIGLDMYRDRLQAAAMDRAMRVDTVAATSNLKLIQDEGNPYSPAFIVYAPVWTFGDKRNFRGHVFIPIRTKDFVEAAVSRRLRASGRITIHEGSQENAEEIYTSRPSGRTSSEPLSEEVVVFGQHWRLRYAPLQRADPVPLTYIVLAGGSAFAMLLLAYVLLVQRRNEDLHALLDARTEQERERIAFVRELNHRVKNSLANVMSIISLTRRQAKDMDSFAESLMQRVRALAASHSLLDGYQWGPTNLGSLANAQLGPYDRTGGRIDIVGQDVLISPNDALTVGLALHELVTNATRYGSLSNEEGRVSLQWDVTDDGWIEVCWLESGGPEVSEPETRGLGLNLIERALAHELGRPVEIRFAPGGLECRFMVQSRDDAPLDPAP